MKCLIVTTHPLSKCLCKLLTEHVVNRLTAMKHEVVIEDLYADKFEPLLTESERNSYYSGSYDSSNFSEQANRLLEAEALVLLFPTWWFSFPAMLKGWFDRVWGPGIAYDHASDLGPIKSRLDNLRKVLVVTTLGAPWWVDRLIMWQPVKRVVKVALLGACAKKSKLKYLSLYNSEKLNNESIARFKHKIDKALNDWGE
ncbi:MAG: flavodoxin family protein [Desulfurivibrio sp.]|nr:flavodoxin family protein [Desulfurivibrio sp.]MBU3937708.1 NAD(P)H-dependent oxidoreductase [Pseudomonadota bacterium]MBU4118442.1 NAD(P)H-dependent oxidoreductase [Pseudomonadota bacterium]